MSRVKEALTHRYSPLVFTFLSRVYKEEHASFLSDYNIEDSTFHLAHSTNCDRLTGVDSEKPSGHVSQQRVTLFRPKPFPRSQNSFRPVFYGTFLDDGNRVVLKGVFTTARTIQLLTSVGYAVCVTFGVLCTLLLAVNLPSNDPPTLLGGILLSCLALAANAGFVAFGQWLARNDVRWLSQRIQAALTQHGGGPQKATGT